MTSRFVSGGTILPGSDGSITGTGITTGIGAVDQTSSATPLNKSGITTVPAGLSTARSGAEQSSRDSSDTAAAQSLRATSVSTRASERPVPVETTAPAPTDPATEARQAEWAAVQASLDAERQDREARRRAEAQGDGEKSLFAILQENKAAKQAKFEEANAIRNQFRALDDDEIDFLDGVEDGKRAEEERRRREVEEGLAAFREAQKGSGGGKEGREVGESGGDGGDTAGDTSMSWEHSGRKRKREKDGAATKIGGLKGVKRKTSVPESGSSSTTTTQQKQPEGPAGDAVAKVNDKGSSGGAGSKAGINKLSMTPAAAPKAKVGLVAYGSDDSDDD